MVDFLPKSGRAVLYPIYKGTYERGDELIRRYPHETAFYKDHVIMWAKDLARSIDYLETRKDIDADRLAYYGFSWGGRMGSDLPAVEKRIKVNVLYVAGPFPRVLPEVDAFNYVTRVKQPTLMLNGDLDLLFPARDLPAPHVRTPRHAGRGQEVAPVPGRTLGPPHGNDQGIAGVARSLPGTCPQLGNGNDGGCPERHRMLILSGELTEIRGEERRGRMA